MVNASAQVLRASSLEELNPLFDFCKTGRLFDVQQWIACDKPINPPAIKPKGRKFRSPLLVAIEHGFHSLVEVLLKGGAVQEPSDCDSPMSRALAMRSRDLVELLVEHGYSPQSVDMTSVLASWDPGLMEYFIERGADLDRHIPFAWAFCNQIRTALNVAKKYQARFPSLKEQLNIGLRYHCMKGNLKWVSLMLWAGADPYVPGAGSDSDELGDDDVGVSAVAYAALYEHYDVFKLRPIRSQPTHPALRECIPYLDDQDGCELLKDLLCSGLDPNDPEDGCSAIQQWLAGIDWQMPDWRSNERPPTHNIDSERARDRMKALHLVAKHGGLWKPTEDELKCARRSLLKMIPDYTVEFVWIMSKYRACLHKDLVALLNSPAMRKHIAVHRVRLDELLNLSQATTLDALSDHDAGYSNSTA